MDKCASNQKVTVTSKVYFVFIYKWVILLSDSNILLQIIGDFWYRCYVTHDWPLWITCTLKYTHIHIYPYCVYVWVFPLYWEVMKDTIYQLCVFCWSEIKYFLNPAYGIKLCCLAAVWTHLDWLQVAHLHKHPLF